MPTLNLQIGDSPIYTNKGHNEMLKIMDINNNDTVGTRYIIEFLRGNVCFTIDI